MDRTDPTLEFHVSRAARDRYGLDAAWFSLSGNVVLADLATTRRFAHAMNRVRDAARHPERTVQAGPLHAMGLIDEILHFVAGLYRQQAKPDAMARALAALERRLGAEKLDATLVRFAELFPPLAVYRGETTLDDYLRGATGGVPHREVVLEELLLLWLANVNPAFRPFAELFDDAALQHAGYPEVVRGLGEFFATEPRFGPDDQALVDMLRSPAIAAPNSLSGQLDYIRRRWGHLLGDFLRRLLVTLDVIREEERAQIMRSRTWAATQRVPVADFHGLEAETERFTPDRDWMPHVVMIAKSAFVWLDQLSRRYGRPVARLDQVPDEELDQLARWGITSLWIIGLWERSRASERIKQRGGNPDAGASAYSLLDYRIAESLGGEPAYENLRDRAWRRGIRLASDMVPNHMGIDSTWVMDHPERFVSLRESPFPSYTFNGPDLSWHDRVGLFLEDHYDDKSDAAVVFKRVDHHTGDVRYVYHGNDGTLTPWNDTAQLDYLNPATREAVIRTILDVARRFPIIRFDAAMTLAKKHYQRLWFPEPGSGGAIPSRAEHGLSRAEFDAAMPVEFWREVVDRIAREAPDTLLLAEAFWLMEGYFVRTLGMHRVYNSAFMNMLRDEDNAQYRSVIKNTIEFDPEILKRYVNFMNNPDERTAVDQFGKGDKYFGVCTLMVTMPGLPMFGHGQIEAFTERYGMEFRRATWDEAPDRGVVERHEREIFPLLHRRAMFAEAGEFLLYDFFTADGHVNEDVFAYSNRRGDDRGLVLYHNRFAHTAGWIRTSAAYAVKSGDGRTRAQRTLAEGLGLTPRADAFCVFRDHVSGLEYVRSSLDLSDRGLYVELDAYRRHVFLDFREMTSTRERPWAELAHELGGRGVPSAEDALRELSLRPVVVPFRDVVNAGRFRTLIDARAGGAATKANGHGRPAASGVTVEKALGELEPALVALAAAVRGPAGGASDPVTIAAAIRARLAAALEVGAAIAEPGPPSAWGAVLGWCVLVGLASAHDRDAVREWLHAWEWDHVLEQALRDLEADSGEAARQVAVIDALLGHAASFAVADADGDATPLVEGWLADDRVQGLLRVHQHEGNWWFRQEAWEDLVRWMTVVAAVEDAAADTAAAPARESRRALADRLIRLARESGYRLDRLMLALAPSAAPAADAPAPAPSADVPTPPPVARR